MTQLLPRFHRRQIESRRHRDDKHAALVDDEQVGRAVADAEENTQTTAGATLGGDRRRLRGIPVAGGACGTSPGTDPLAALLRRVA